MINGIEDEVYHYVNNELDKIEEEFNVTILYAVESGSRGWGFANENSDYDVRFIYMRPINDYLLINRKRDVIDIHDLGRREYDYDLDLSGWDITKTLSLHRKSNPALREYILHHMVYRGNTDFLRNLPRFDLNTLKQAYGSMTYNNYMKYIKRARTDDFSPRVVKTYCYCIRQILAWILIDEYNNVNAPIHIDKLLWSFRHDKNNVIGEGLLNDMEDLINFYRSGCKNNKLTEEKILNLSKWIDTYLQVTKTAQGEKGELPDIDIYNKRFIDILADYQSPIIKLRR